MTSPKAPSITWKTSITHEALRILYYLNRLPDQALQNRGFLVLPYPNTKAKKHIIVLPDLDFSKIPKVWNQVSKLTPVTPMTAPNSLTKAVIELLLPRYTPPQSELNHLKTNWEAIHQKFFDSLNQVLSEISQPIANINIIVSRSGTCSQFNLVTPKQKNLTVYLRCDSQISDIAQAIILSTIRWHLETVEKRSWEEIESISDFLLKYTPIHDSLTPHIHQSMMLSLQQLQNGPLYKKSQDFQSKIGIPTTSHWQIKSDSIFYNQTKIDGLTDRQFNLLKKLVDNQGQIITIDEIASSIWSKDENYSLWAIVKEIARIRSALVSSGAPGHILKSHRKKGYSLL